MQTEKMKAKKTFRIRVKNIDQCMNHINPQEIERQI